jgi:Na+-translocating ferredoxin:NAD+ oxidoreductase RNF subunit RnfB
MIESILFPVLSIAGLSLIFGALLGFSAKKFAVKVNPKVEKIAGILPGVNCGGCGFAGCAVFAQAVAKEEASYEGCPAGGAATAAEIAKTLGIDPVASNRKVAFIKCHGVDDNVKRNYIYDGPRNCVAASQLATGGNKSCSYSCIGLASCKNVCAFNAIQIIDSIAWVDSKKCTACGKCVTVCPKNLIEIVPDKSKVRVLCNSRDRGRVVRANCRAGCIGCALCVKACNSDAITIKDNIAQVNYEKCTLCLKCVDKCPAKAIKVIAQ